MSPDWQQGDARGKADAPMTTETFTQRYGTPAQRARTRGWNLALDAVWTRLSADPARQWRTEELHALLTAMIRHSAIETSGSITL